MSSNTEKVNVFMCELADLLNKHSVDVCSRHGKKICFLFKELENGTWGPPLFVQIYEDYQPNGRGHWLDAKTINRWIEDNNKPDRKGDNG